MVKFLWARASIAIWKITGLMRADFRGWGNPQVQWEAFDGNIMFFGRPFPTAMMITGGIFGSLNYINVDWWIHELALTSIRFVISVWTRSMSPNTSITVAKWPSKESDQRLVVSHCSFKELRPFDDFMSCTHQPDRIWSTHRPPKKRTDINMQCQPKANIYIYCILLWYTFTIVYLPIFGGVYEEKNTSVTFCSLQEVAFARSSFREAPLASLGDP